MRKCCIKARPKPSWANSKFCVSMSGVKSFFGFSTTFSFGDGNTFLSFGLAPYPACNFLSRWLTTVTSPTSRGMQHNPGFSWTASCNGLSGLPSRYTLATCLAFVSFLWTEFYNCFPLSLTLRPEPDGQICQVLLLDGYVTWLSYSITFASTSFCWFLSQLNFFKKIYPLQKQKA